MLAVVDAWYDKSKQSHYALVAIERAKVTAILHSLMPAIEFLFLVRGFSPRSWT